MVTLEKILVAVLTPLPPASPWLDGVAQETTSVATVWSNVRSFAVVIGLGMVPTPPHSVVVFTVCKKNHFKRYYLHFITLEKPTASLEMNIKIM